MRGILEFFALATLTLISACLDEWFIRHVPGGIFSPGLTFGVLVLPLFIPRRSLLAAGLSSLASFGAAYAIMNLLDKLPGGGDLNWYAFGGIGASLLVSFFHATKVAKPRPLDYLLLTALGSALMESNRLTKPLELLEFGYYAAMIFWWQFGMALALRYTLFRQQMKA